MFNKKKLMSVAGAVAIAMSIFGNSVYADNNMAPFNNYTLKAHCSNTYTKSRYRWTTNQKDSWKVNLAFSTEGNNTIATFWISQENKSHTQLADTHNVHQGSGNHYYAAYQSAKKKDVCLSFENNNYTANTYSVSGYWDEETGIIVK